MARGDCVHGHQRHTCEICRDLDRILSQQTISARTLTRLVMGIEHERLSTSINRIRRNIFPPDYRVNINNDMRRATRDLIESPRNRGRQGAFQGAIQRAFIRREININSNSSNLNSPSYPSDSNASSSSRFSLPSTKASKNKNTRKK